jgi:small subunit ribosomal protein S1
MSHQDTLQEDRPVNEDPNSDAPPADPELSEQAAPPPAEAAAPPDAEDAEPAPVEQATAAEAEEAAAVEETALALEEVLAQAAAAAEDAAPAASAAAAAEAAPPVEEAGAAEAAAPVEDDLPLDVANQTPEMLALVDAMVNKRAVDGQVIGWNKGGYHVAIDRIAAFCPVSQIEIGNPRSPKRYLDKTFKFQVIEIQKGGRRVVVSRSEALKTERETLAAQVRSMLKPGMVREGKISSITDFGAFVDLGGGIEGLVHVSEISRRRVEHPKETLQVGQEVKVSVLKIEKGGQRISLSMKRLEEDPWSGIKQRFTPGDAFTGTILRRADFGIFVEVEPGLEGLVHNSRLPFGAEEDEEALVIGGTVEGWIHEIDAKRRRLSLSLRPLAKGNPWHGVDERLPVGTVIKGKVERLAPFGAFIELEPGLTGLLPFSTLGSAVGNPRKQFHPGKEVTVRVLAIDRDKRRISLGTEQSQAEGSQVDYRDYKKRQGKSSGGLNVMAAAFEKVKLRAGSQPDA